MSRRWSEASPRCSTRRSVDSSSTSERVLRFQSSRVPGSQIQVPRFQGSRVLRFKGSLVNCSVQPRLAAGIDAATQVLLVVHVRANGAAGKRPEPIKLFVVQVSLLLRFNQAVLYLPDRALGKFQEADILRRPESIEAFRSISTRRSDRVTDLIAEF